MGVNGHAPLPNGYVIGFMNYQPGYLLEPKKAFGGFPHADSVLVSGIYEIQLSGRYILGKKWQAEGPDDYFLLDTSNQFVWEFATVDTLSSAAEVKGIHFAAESPEKLYVRYRPTWFDWSFPIVSVLGFVALLLWLWPEFHHLREQNLPL